MYLLIYRKNNRALISSAHAWEVKTQKSQNQKRDKMGINRGNLAFWNFIGFDVSLAMPLDFCL